jgi:hypothetical protein
VLLAAGGLAMGRATADVSFSPGSSNGELTARGGSVAASLASGMVGADSIMSIDDALAMMRRAESEYRLAAAYIAASDTTGASGAVGVDRYRARLAALDRVSDAALAAVNEAPADPIVNQYLISTRAARAVTLQQLNSSLPPGMSLASY